MSRDARTTVPVHPLLARRWSTRAFDETRPIPERTLLALLEAARWAPSANNSQPWRFFVARRGEQAFGTLFDALAPGNQAWAGRAAALVLVLADAPADRPWALYDTGQAVAHLTVQAEAEGLAVHQMGGFDASAVGAPEGLTPVVVLALGHRDDTAELPEALAAREHAPRVRRPLAEIVLPTPGAARLTA